MISSVASNMARITAWLVVILTAGFILYGIFRHGLTWETHTRLWRDVIDRSSGPMTFRFFLQPSMATIAALHDGIRDARSGRAPFLPTLLRDKAGRARAISEELNSTARIILLGFGMDAIYQWRVLGTFYPGEAVVITLILAVLPYVILRGPINRIARIWFARHPQSQSNG